MANTHCPRCGKNMTLVGRVHNCIPERPLEALDPLIDEVKTTYRYRDTEKRRAYMRDYMRRYRAAVHEEER